MSGVRIEVKVAAGKPNWVFGGESTKRRIVISRAVEVQCALFVVPGWPVALPLTPRVSIRILYRAAGWARPGGPAKCSVGV